MLIVDVVVPPNICSKEVWVNNQPIGFLYNRNQRVMGQCHQTLGSYRRGLTPGSVRFDTLILRRDGCGVTDHAVSKRNGE